jgi:hypothetical protein
MKLPKNVLEIKRKLENRELTTTAANKFTRLEGFTPQGMEIPPPCPFCDKPLFEFNRGIVKDFPYQAGFYVCSKKCNTLIYVILW